MVMLACGICALLIANAIFWKVCRKTIERKFSVRFLQPFYTKHHHKFGLGREFLFRHGRLDHVPTVGTSYSFYYPRNQVSKVEKVVYNIEEKVWDIYFEPFIFAENCSNHTEEIESIKTYAKVYGYGWIREKEFISPLPIDISEDELLKKIS